MTDKDSSWDLLGPIVGVATIRLGYGDYGAKVDHARRGPRRSGRNEEKNKKTKTFKTSVLFSHRFVLSSRGGEVETPPQIKAMF